MQSIFQRIWNCDPHDEDYQLYLLYLYIVEMTNYRRGESAKPKQVLELELELEASSLSRAHRNHMMAPPPWQVCIVTRNSDDIDFTHGPLSLGTCYDLERCPFQLCMLNSSHGFTFSWTSTASWHWLESVDGCCWWLNVVVCVGSLYIYSNLWEFKLATSLKFTTYDFKADSLFYVFIKGSPKQKNHVTNACIAKCWERSLQGYSKNIRFMEISDYFSNCTSWILFSILLGVGFLSETIPSILVSFWEGLFSGAMLVSGRVCVFVSFFSDVYNAATRYSSLEADEFDEGSAAEEADASVTQIGRSRSI